MIAAESLRGYAGHARVNQFFNGAGLARAFGDTAFYRFCGFGFICELLNSPNRCLAPTEGRASLHRVRIEHVASINVIVPYQIQCRDQGLEGSYITWVRRTSVLESGFPNSICSDEDPCDAIFSNVDSFAVCIKKIQNFLPVLRQTGVIDIFNPRINRTSI